MKFLFALLIIISSLSISTVLASECASAPLLSESGIYNGCEIVFGEDVQFRDPESVPENACPLMCSSLNELELVAMESHALDETIDLNVQDPNFNF
jgi:hypothetical protein